jgi:hypothetical protein
VNKPQAVDPLCEPRVIVEVAGDIFDRAIVVHAEDLLQLGIDDLSPLVSAGEKIPQ